MKNFIFAKAVFIIIAGLVGSYFIIKSGIITNPEIKLSNKELKKENIANLISENPIKWIKETKDNFQKIDAVSAGKQVENFNDKNQSVNLTEFIAQSSFNQMKILDQGGKNPFDNLSSNNSESRKIIENTIAGIKNPDLIFNPVINDKDLKISSDNSKEVQFNYFKKIQQINNDFIDPKYQRSAMQIVNDINSDCLGNGSDMNLKIANRYKNLSNIYLNLIIPSIQLDIHKKMIIYYKKSELVYRAIADCKKDPVKGYLAVQVMPQLESQSFEIQSFLNNLNLLK